MEERKRESTRAVVLQRRENTPGMGNGGRATANCSKQCSIRWSIHSSTSFCISGMQQLLQKPLETVLDCL
jgi:hypothetical protein